MGFLLFVLAALPFLDIAVISWPFWPGHTKGMEITLLDVLALAIYWNSPKSRHPLPFRTAMVFYFLAVLFSVFQAGVPFASAFYLWQIARVFLLYAVVARASVDYEVVKALIKGMAIGLCLQALFVIWQRFGLGIVQTKGTLAHQNLLGLVANFVTIPLIALLLSGEKHWTIRSGPLAGIIVAALTTSRATLGLAGAGIGLVFFLSIIRQYTPRKAMVAVAGLIVAGMFAPIVIAAFEKRFANEPFSGEYDERTAYEKTAKLIINDYPLGIGANNFVVVANAQGYMERGGVTAFGGSRSGHVHNFFLLTTAEIGFLGIVALAFVLLLPLLTAFKCGWRNRYDPKGDLLLGLGVGLLMVYLHSFYEWIFVTSTVQYFFAVMTGMVAGVSQQLGYWGHGRKSGNRRGGEKFPKEAALTSSAKKSN